MTLPPELSKLNHAEKDALIQALTSQLAVTQARIATQDARIAALEARLDVLTQPPSPPDNSYKSPIARPASAGPAGPPQNWGSSGERG